MDDEYIDLVALSKNNATSEDYEEEVSQKINIFDLINDISNNGKYIENYLYINKKMPKEYSQYMINRAFANYEDTIALSNIMNIYYSLPDEMHWRFLKNRITPMKRYSKWYKNIEDKEPIELLAKYFNCTVKEMRKNICALSEEKINELLAEIDPERFKYRKLLSSKNGKNRKRK